jgi:hypothetical protein
MKQPFVLNTPATRVWVRKPVNEPSPSRKDAHTPMFHKVRDIIRTDGLLGLAFRSIAFAYRRVVRPCIPFGKPIYYAGIPICHDRKWGDGIVPASWIPSGANSDQPDYEAGLLAGLAKTVESGDRVVIIGGGLGVTAVAAALRTGPTGNVRCFEGSQQHVRFVQRTAARNGVTNIVVHHAVVEKAIDVYGSGGDVGRVFPSSQLPECNVLELDCEGAEVEILRELTISPRVILVETHGIYGAPTHETASLLEDRGYVVSDLGLAVHDDYCKRNDIRVLLGIQR